MKRFDPSKSPEFGTEENDAEMLDWLDEARTASDLYLLSGWVRERIAVLKEDRLKALALAEERPPITPEMAEYFLTSYNNGCPNTWTALRNHAAKLSKK